MRTITDYKVVSGYDPIEQKQTIEALVTFVKWAIHEGWEPLGGVAVSGGVFLQAMVQYRE